MILDIGTIIWKEAKELIFRRGSMRGGGFGILIFLAVFGIFLPLQSGRDWIDQPINLFLWGWVPFLLVSTVVADSFAGERERHTLETLLASRLSDRAILFGKILSAIIYGWGLTLIGIVISLVAVNVAFWEGELLLFSLPIGVGSIVISFLVAALAANLGVLVSLRASTVRQAQQTFSFLFMALFIPIFLLPMLPESWQVQLAQVLSGLNVNNAILWATLILLAINGILLFFVSARFQRTKLILD